MFSKKSKQNKAQGTQSKTKRQLRKSKKRKRDTGSGLEYGNMEPRCLLATLTGFDAGTGAVTISLDATGDEATVETVGGFVTVNGSDQFEDAAGGSTTVSLTDVTSITATGSDTTSQTLTFQGDFSSSAGGNIDSITAQGTEFVVFVGDYESQSVTVNDVSQTFFESANISGDVAVDSLRDTNIRRSDIGGNLISESIGGFNFSDSNITGDVSIESNFANIGANSIGGDFSIESDGNIGLNDVTISGDANFEFNEAFILRTSVGGDLNSESVALTSLRDVTVAGDASVDSEEYAELIGGSIGGDLRSDAAFGAFILGADVDGATEVLSGGDARITGAFDGPVSASSSNNITIESTQDGSVSVTSGGSTTLSYEGDVLINAANVGTDLTVVSDARIVTNSTIVVGGDMNLTAAQEIMGNANVGGETTFVATGAQISFGGAFDGPVNATSAQRFRLLPTQDVQFGDIDSTGQLAVLAQVDGLSITQTADSTFSSNDSSSGVNAGSFFDVPGGTITLNNANNDFLGQVVVETAAASFADANDILFGELAIAGDLTTVAGGEISIVADADIEVSGTALLNAGTNIVLDNEEATFGSVDVTSGGSTTLSYGTDEILIDGANVGGDLTVDSDAGITSIRVAETVVDPVLSPNNFIIAIDPDGDSGTSQDWPVEHAINGHPVEYTNFGNENSGFIVTPNAGSGVVHQFQLTTSFDNLNYDPTSWVLYGTNDSISSTQHSEGTSETWTLIDSASIDLPVDREVLGPMVDVDNSTAYTSYKMIFPTLRDSSVSNPRMSIGEVQFFSVSTTAAANSEIAVDGTTNLTAAGDVTLTNGDNDFVGVVNAGATNVSLADANDVVFDALAVARNLTTVAGGEISDVADADIEVDGTATLNAGTDIVLDSEEATIGSLNVTSVGSTTLTYGTGDIVIEGADVGTDLTVTSDVDITSLTTPSTIVDPLLSPSDAIIAIDSDGDSSSPAAEGPANAIDGTEAKYLNFGRENSGFIVTPATGSSVVDTFQLTTANDFPERDPTTWRLYGTNDSISSTNNSTGTAEAWTLIDSGSIELPSARDTLGPIVDVNNSNSTAYTSYKLVFPTLRDSTTADANSVQIGEAQFFAPATTAAAVNGEVSVSGATNLTAAGDVTLTNTANDFVGVVNAGGTNASLADANDVVFDTVAVARNLTTVAGGDISNVADANIDIDNNAFLTADSIDLGNQAGDNVEITRVGISATGDASLSQDGNVRLLDTTATNLQVASTSQIRNGANSTIAVTGDTALSAPSVVVGNQADDSFDTGRLNVNANFASIEENSDIELYGDNEVNNLVLNSTGALTDADSASLNVSNLARLQGDAIMIGDSATYEARITEFNSSGDVSIEQQSRLALFGDNTADSLELISSDRVIDTTNATTNVTSNASFAAPFVILGDSAADEFNTGSLSFESSNFVSIKEDSSTLIVGDNETTGLVIESAGAIENADSAVLTTNGRATLTGTQINIGDAVDDTVSLRSLNFNSGGSVTVEQSGRMFLLGNNTADSLDLSATGSLIDQASASLAVNGNAKFAGTFIGIGDTATDSVSAQRYTFESTGTVIANVEGDLILFGDTTANVLNLTSSGDIFDATRSTTTVNSLLSLDTGFAHLGSNLDADSNPQLNFGRLTVNTTETANITSGSSFALAGTSNVGDRLVLKSDGNITDANTSSLTVENFARFTANDIIIGELADDCFDIIAGTNQLSVEADGVSNVNTGC